MLAVSSLYGRVSRFGVSDEGVFLLCSHKNAVPHMDPGRANLENTLLPVLV